MKKSELSIDSKSSVVLCSSVSLCEKKEIDEQIAIRLKYEGYIAQEEKAAARAKGQDAVRIPDWLDYWKVPSLRYECREKLTKVKPENLGQALRIPGVNPADVAVLSLIIKRGYV